MDPNHPFEAAIERLGRRNPLDAADREAIAALPYVRKRVAAGAHLVRDGDRTENCAMLITGFAHRYKITGEGARQIVSLHLPGEFVDLHNSLLETADHSAQTLTDAEIAFIPHHSIRSLALARPAVGQALWRETLIDASIFREWVMNVGRRDARARIAHILCEFSLRLQAAGLAENHCYELPMTQEQLADAVGLTSVHVNRVLRQLAEEGLIARQRRSIVIGDWKRMREAGDFSERYLHPELS
ncbi:Crp/Fnr family transcriptional regulator [Allosphingosinicella sp.]|jgi:CRP-like cAMP-binding protein|uniref:Crp/Fnr family transcriptional regulator n=1 Tax=Allosphingosinicella sp. TaxID=2823234 RepID=UPI002F0F9236